MRQIANGFDFKVRTFQKYDINGYCFRTASKELSMPGRKTTNSGVSAIGEGGVEYYGRLEEVYELHYYGENPPNVVVFKCHWFDPTKTRRAHEHVGLVEIRQDRKLSGDDVFIVAQQATQVFYLPYSRQSVKNLEGWYVVYDVPPHLRPPPPNEEDYEPQIDPITYDGEFFQESRGVRRRLRNCSTSTLNTEEQESHEDEEEVEVQEVTNPDDLTMLDRLKKSLPHDVPEPDDDVIHDDTYDTDDDYASVDLGEETDDPDY